MLIDTHAHLNFKAFDKDLDEIIKRAKNAGVEKIIIPGAKIDSSKKAVEIAQKYDSCFATIGIHPHHVGKYTSLLYSNEVINLKDNLNNLAQDKKAVGIGEIGLDYHEYKGYLPVTDETKKHQKELLILQIEIATKYNLPIIFHCRDAHDDQLELIERYINSTKKKIRGVFHCFGGGNKHLEKIINMGLYLGFDGNITYPDNQNLQESVKLTPLNKILLETDSPYLTPIPYRGARNEPAYLAHVVAFAAKIHKITVEEMTRISTENALKLFML